MHVLGGLNRGGAETMIMNLYRAIDKTKVQFDFIIHNEDANAYCNEIKELGGAIYIFPKFVGKNFFSYRNYWKLFLKKHPEYKILHSHVRSYAVVFLEIAKKYGLTTIVHSHSTSNGSGLKSYIKNILQIPLKRKSDYLFACSSISGEWLFGKKALSLPNYKMVKNAIDTQRYQLNKELRIEYREEFQVSDKIVYGHIGRLSEPKNHKFLLDIFKDILVVQPNAVLMIVGEGPCRQKIEAQIQVLGLEQYVIMTGVREDIPQLLGAMDIFLFPSLWEGLPVTVIEAQAAGLPCLVSNKVTDEVAITEAVTYLPIDEGTACWVEVAMCATEKRFQVIDKIKEAGFDVYTSAEELVAFYEGLLE